MRNLIVLVVLALALAGLIGVNRLTGGWHYVMSAPSGELMYVAAFDADADDFNADWEQYGGRLSAQISDGVMRIEAGEVNSGPYSAAAPYFADFDARVDAWALSGPENNGYGMIFRLVDRRNYYLFLVSSDGYYQVRRVVDGDEKELSTWIESPLVNTGFDAVNQLRVVARDDQFQFFVNGEQVQVCIPNNPDAMSTYFMDTCIDGQMFDTLTDDSIAQGRIGVVAAALEQPDVVVAFDNLVVYSP